MYLVSFRQKKLQSKIYYVLKTVANFTTKELPAISEETKANPRNERTYFSISNFTTLFTLTKETVTSKDILQSMLSTIHSSWPSDQGHRYIYHQLLTELKKSQSKE